MPVSSSGVIVDLLGFLTGVVLYVMLLVMVWRGRARHGASLWSGLGRLPLLTGVFGLIWNVGALTSFGMRAVGSPAPAPLVVAVAFGALGFLPAAVVHSLLEGRETAIGRRLSRPAIGLAYALSTTAMVLHIAHALSGASSPSRAALWVLTVGFTLLTVSLIVATRQQPVGRRGIWVAALSIFAVSALHFGSHVGNEAWWVELLGHHASLPLALAILHQDYRFALADLFLKHAIALILLVAVAMGVYAALMAPVLQWYRLDSVTDPRVISSMIVAWITTALTYPVLQRLATWLVDRAVLRRPDYEDALGRFVIGIEGVDDEAAVIAQAAATVGEALGTSDIRTSIDPLPSEDTRVVVSGPDLRALVAAPSSVAIVRLRTVDAPHPSLTVGVLSGGRRLLSDDLQWLHAVARLATRRIDAQRVTQERLSRNAREQMMERLATEAELRALRAQLHPHFLFNALTTVGYLIQQSPTRALQVLLQLTSVLRGVLRRSHAEFSTLAEEIDLISSYLEIEHARFEERLRLSIEIAGDAAACAVPSLLLQPLVENAVKHGLAPQLAGGLVTIRAGIHDGRLRLVVADTGAGFDVSTMDRAEGVGLRSVGERLRAHYGTAARCDVQSVRGAGTIVTIELPASPIASLDTPTATGQRRVG